MGMRPVAPSVYAVPLDGPWVLDGAWVIDSLAASLAAMHPANIPTSSMRPTAAPASTMRGV